MHELYKRQTDILTDAIMDLTSPLGNSNPFGRRSRHHYSFQTKKQGSIYISSVLRLFAQAVLANCMEPRVCHFSLYYQLSLTFSSSSSFEPFEAIDRLRL